MSSSRASRARHGASHSSGNGSRLPVAPTLLTNEAHDALTADLREAEATLTIAEEAHEATPARLLLHQVNPGQQVLDTEVKLFTHAIQIAAFNTATTLARDLRVHTGYTRANHEAHTLIRQVLTSSGDLDPTIDGVLTIRLDPIHTKWSLQHGANDASKITPDQRGESQRASTVRS